SSTVISVPDARSRPTAIPSTIPTPPKIRSRPPTPRTATLRRSTRLTDEDSRQQVERLIDLRSDTVTLPTPEMREAIARAELGDDVYGEDPTVNRLEAMAASMMGKEAALLVPSGTMGNLAAMLSHCGRGVKAIVGSQSHTMLYEAGGASALGGIVLAPVRNTDDGELDIEELERELATPDDAHFARPGLVVIENTHNRCGGAPIALS